MANTLGTTNGVLIAQKALETLVTRLPILSRISIDTGDNAGEEAKFGQQVIMHLVTAATAVDFVEANGYASSDRTQADVPITINKHAHHTYSVTDREASATDIDLIERFAITAAYSLGSKVVADLCAIILNANFANKTTKALGANKDGFSRSTLIDIGEALSNANVAPMGRFALLHSSYYASLCRDATVVQAYSNPNGNAIATGVLSSLHGFDVMEFVGLPDNGENLKGFAGTRDALCLATRLPTIPTDMSTVPGTITNVIEPSTGLGLQVREWYDIKMGKASRTYTLMYGVAKGITDCLHRIVSA